MNSPVVLDTHAWMWLAEGRQDLQRRAVTMMETASESSLLRVSAISLWEIAMLEARGRLRFDIPCEDWIEAALGLPGLSLVPLTPGICVESTRLPGEPVGDPADRLIVATARMVSGTLITRDGRLLRYARSGNLKAMAV